MMISDHITIDETAKDILRDDLIRHSTGRCDCREQDGQTYLCKAGEWLKGVVPSKHIVEDYYYNLTKRK